LPVNRRFHWLKLLPLANLTAGGTAITAAADIIDTVELYVSGKMQRNVTAAWLQKWAAFNGLAIQPNCVGIYFSEPARASVTDEQASAWDLTDESAFTIRVKFKPGIRHNHSAFFVLMHDFCVITPMMRANLTDAFVYRQTAKRCGDWVDLFADDDMQQAAALGQYEFVHKTAFRPIKRLLPTEDELGRMDFVG
jgi:hypothetical protein